MDAGDFAYPGGFRPGDRVEVTEPRLRGMTATVLSPEAKVAIMCCGRGEIRDFLRAITYADIDAGRVCVALDFFGTTLTGSFSPDKIRRVET